MNIRVRASDDGGDRRLFFYPGEGSTTDGAFDAITRRAADVVSRRSSLLVMGGAALTAAVAGPAITKAGKAGKKAKKKCKRQGGQCREFVEEVCSDIFEDPSEEEQREECIEEFSECCGFLAKCKATAFFDCVVETLQGSPMV